MSEKVDRSEVIAILSNLSVLIGCAPSPSHAEAAKAAAGELGRIWDCRVCGFAVLEGPALEWFRVNGMHSNALGNDSSNKGTAYCPNCQDETLRAPSSSLPAAQEPPQ